MPPNNMNNDRRLSGRPILKLLNLANVERSEGLSRSCWTVRVDIDKVVDVVVATNSAILLGRSLSFFMAISKAHSQLLNTVCVHLPESLVTVNYML